MTFAGILAHKIQVEGALVGCIREFQNSLDDSVYALMASEIRRMEIPGFKILNNKINHISNGGARFKGLARSIEAIKSLFGFKYFWLEEGQFISDDSLKILTPTLREADSELWISANPLSSADPFSQRFILPFRTELETNGFYEDELHYIVKINYSDNPWFPATLEAERQHDFENLPRAMYDHIWEGEFNDSVEDSIILAEWFDAAVDAHKKLGYQPTGAVVASHDPSDLGTDDKGLVIRQGSVVLFAEGRKFGDIGDGCDWAIDTSLTHDVDMFIWDCEGLGIGLKRQVETAFKGKKVDFKMFKGSETPWKPSQIYKPLAELGRRSKERTNQDTFRNRRAQFYWQLRDRFYATYLAVEKGKYIDPDDMISLSSEGIKDIKQLRSEVCRIPRKYNASGKIQIMSKIEMKRLKILSPNISDSLMMSMMPPDVLSLDGPMKFDTVY